MGGRSYESIDNAKASLYGDTSETVEKTVPLGYHKGFRLSYSAGQLTIGKGLKDIRGAFTKMTTDYTVSGEDFVASGSIIRACTYYVYVDKALQFKIDSVAPLWDGDNIGYYHPTLFTHGFIGQFYINASGVYTDILNYNPSYAEDIAPRSITASKIVAGTITATELAADSITAEKMAANSIEAVAISATVLETLLLKTDELYIGFTSVSGSTTWDAPGEGDRIHYVNGTLDYYYEYTGGSWVTTNGIKIGGFIGALFLSMIGCTGIYHPANPPASIEFLPNPNYRIFDFENDYDDQDGNDDWDTKTNLAFDSGTYKINNYSLSATSGNNGILAVTNTGSIGESQALGGWFYISSSGTATDTTAFALMYLYEADNNIGLFLGRNLGNNTLTLKYLVEKNGSIVANLITVCDIDLDEWVYIGYSYDSTTDKIYVIYNDTILESSVLGGSWGSGTFDYIAVYTKNNQVTDGITASVNIDELLFYWDKYLDPNILAQHYTHGVAWNTLCSKADILIRPNTDGRVVLDYDGNIKPLCQWYKVPNPAGGWFDSKTTFTADRFLEADGGFEVDFSTLVASGVLPVGTRIVRVLVNIGSTDAWVYCRPAGDDTYATNTPHANSEYHAWVAKGGPHYAEIILNDEYKCEFAVANSGSDVYVSYPSQAYSPLPLE